MASVSWREKAIPWPHGPPVLPLHTRPPSCPFVCCCHSSCRAEVKHAAHRLDPAHGFWTDPAHCRWCVELVWHMSWTWCHVLRMAWGRFRAHAACGTCANQPCVLTPGLVWIGPCWSQRMGSASPGEGPVHAVCCTEGQHAGCAAYSAVPEQPCTLAVARVDPAQRPSTSLWVWMSSTPLTLL